MKTLLLSLFLALSMLFPFHEKVYSQAFMADDGYVEFISRAPLLEFKGVSNNLTGLVDFDENLVDFYVDLNTIDTGIERRNRDMRNSYLKTDKFPFAEFTGSFTGSVDPGFSGKKDVLVTGTFKIHGVERNIQVEGTIEKKDSGLQVEASWTILLEDYNIDRPRVLFYELADEQKVNISILLRETDPS